MFEMIDSPTSNHHYSTTQKPKVKMNRSNSLKNTTYKP